MNGHVLELKSEKLLRKGRAEGKAEGRAEGHAAGRAEERAENLQTAIERIMERNHVSREEAEAQAKFILGLDEKL